MTELSPTAQVFRVLRVLRTINKVPMLKAIVQAVFSSGPMLTSVSAEMITIGRRYYIPPQLNVLTKHV